MKYTVMGRLTKEIELVADKKFYTLAIATHPKKEETDFYNLTITENQAKILFDLTKKGSRVLFNGTIKPNVYEVDGKKVYSHNFYVNEFEIIDFKNKEVE